MKLLHALIPVLSVSIAQAADNLVKDNFDFASKQLVFAVDCVEKVTAKNADRKTPLVSPRSLNKKGDLNVIPARDWTSGFFPGELWYMYEYTKDAKWEKLARQFTDQLEQEKTNATTHDMGFKMYCSYGNGYRLTNDENYKAILLESAKTLAGRYNEKVKAIRSWDWNRSKWQFPVIIDNMLNLELLFWASKESGDPKFKNIATNHAKTTMKNHFRDDYSSYHVVDYDPKTGKPIQKMTHQGYADESSWSRGQGWGIYGYTMCYRETGDKAFLEQAKKIANYIFSHPNLPKDLIPYWDYNAPEIPKEPRDVSAATVTASALYELSLYDKANASKYIGWADAIIQNLTKNYRSKYKQNKGFLLLSSTGEKQADKEVDVPIVYGDYYFLEALLRKDKLAKGQPLFPEKK